MQNEWAVMNLEVQWGRKRTCGRLLLPVQQSAEWQKTRNSRWIKLSDCCTLSLCSVKLIELWDFCFLAVVCFWLQHVKLNGSIQVYTSSSSCGVKTKSQLGVFETIKTSMTVLYPHGVDFKIMWAGMGWWKDAIALWKTQKLVLVWPLLASVASVMSILFLISPPTVWKYNTMLL